MKKFLNASQLKLIAVILMLLDHSYKIFRNPIFDFIIQHINIPEDILIWLMELIGLLGASSFWIFAYFIAEGFYFTHSRKSYLLRLGLLALISEVPFQYMICIIMERPIQLHIGATNIFFTLFLGGLAICSYDKCKQRRILKWLQLIPPLLCMGTALILQTDYGFIGVAAIFVTYICKKTFRLRYLSIAILLQTAVLILNESALADILYAFLHCCYALLSILLLKQYNGKKGYAPKWLLYLFYPIHISILVIMYLLIL